MIKKRKNFLFDTYGFLFCCLVALVSWLAWLVVTHFVNLTFHFV